MPTSGLYALTHLRSVTWTLSARWCELQDRSYTRSMCDVCDTYLCFAFLLWTSGPIPHPGEAQPLLAKRQMSALVLGSHDPAYRGTVRSLSLPEHETQTAPRPRASANSPLTMTNRAPVVLPGDHGWSRDSSPVQGTAARVDQPADQTQKMLNRINHVVRGITA